MVVVSSIFYHESRAFFSPKRALVYGEKYRFIKPYVDPFLKVRMKIICPQFLKCIYSMLKFLYLIDFKRNTADISLINHHTFYERAVKF